MRAHGVLVHEFADDRRQFYLADSPNRAGVGSQLSLAEGRTSSVARVELAPDSVNIFDVPGQNNPGRFRAEIDLSSSATTGSNAKLHEALDRWRTALQDRYLPVLRMQQRPLLLARAGANWPMSGWASNRH